MGQRIGRLQRVALREVWSHEALDFTTWLEENIEILGEATNLRLSSVQREKPSGAFSVDLIARDEDGRSVVIENQLERSDHDHLGKLLTYLVGLEARRAIWIVADPRPEHVGVVAWLNETSPVDFYLLKLEAIQIGDSKPAALLTQIVGPSEEIRDVGQQKKEMVDQERLRYQFFEGLLTTAKHHTQLHANISPSRHPAVGTSVGIRGLAFNYVVLRHDARVELYIDTGDWQLNRLIFEALHNEKEPIQSLFDSPLEWDAKEGRRAFRIRKDFTTGGYEDKQKWPQIQRELIQTMTILEQALRFPLKVLKETYGDIISGRSQEES